MLRRVAIGIAVVMSGYVLGADMASAQSCRAIAAELADLQSGGGGGSSRYEQAFREQAAVLNRTERQAQRAGCFGGGFLFFQARPEPICRTLVPKLRQMEANLNKLDRLRRRGGGDMADRRRARALQAMYRDQGCDGSRRLEARRDFDQEQAFEPEMYERGGTFRTLCVRTCDGYYFPVSFSTTRSQFATDAQTCQSMCPGAKAELYYYSNPGSGPEEMVSISGEPYRDLSTAFQYRTSFNPSCTCNSASSNQYAMLQTTIPAAVSVPAAAEPEEKLPRIPDARPAPGEDPETVANLEGSYSPRSTPAAKGTLTSQAPGSSKPIRVVGPVYWGAQEKEGVVLTPVPN